MFEQPVSSFGSAKRVRCERPSMRLPVVEFKKTVHNKLQDKRESISAIIDTNCKGVIRLPVNFSRTKWHTKLKRNTYLDSLEAWT